MRVIRLGLVLLIAGVLLIAAIGKLLDNRLFAETLAKWQLFPSWNLLPLGVVASLSELALAVWLFSGWRLPQAAIFAVLFHLGYVAATVITLLRGIRLADCGCFGILFPHPLNWLMAFEDLGFAALSFALYRIARRGELPSRTHGFVQLRGVRELRKPLIAAAVVAGLAVTIILGRCDATQRRAQDCDQFAKWN